MASRKHTAVVVDSQGRFLTSEKAPLFCQEYPNAKLFSPSKAVQLAHRFSARAVDRYGEGELELVLNTFFGEGK